MSLAEGLCSNRHLLRLLKIKKASIEVSVLFVNDKAIKGLNQKYRGMNEITDVLSFPQITSENKNSFLLKKEAPIFLGDIVINVHYAKRHALSNGSSFYYEVSRLLIHGLLHLLGYDHEKNKYQKKKMSLAEAKLQDLLGKS